MKELEVQFDVHFFFSMKLHATTMAKKWKMNRQSTPTPDVIHDEDDEDNKFARDRSESDVLQHSYKANQSR